MVVPEPPRQLRLYSAGRGGYVHFQVSVELRLALRLKVHQPLAAEAGATAQPRTNAASRAMRISCFSFLRAARVVDGATPGWKAFGAAGGRERDGARAAAGDAVAIDERASRGRARPGRHAVRSDEVRFGHALAGGGAHRASELDAASRDPEDRDARGGWRSDEVALLVARIADDAQRLGRRWSGRARPASCRSRRRRGQLEAAPSPARARRARSCRQG